LKSARETIAMADHPFTQELKNAKEYFDRGTRCFDESHSTFAPVPEIYTVAQQVAHVAVVVDWFVDGAFNPKGFCTDFEKHETDTHAFSSLKAAREKLDRSFAAAIAKFEATSMAEFQKEIAPGLLGGLPRAMIASGIPEHTAHHRGALTIYARLLGKKPAMPYMEM
jgi:uncharacterized damage-inducible protein DinB